MTAESQSAVAVLAHRVNSLEYGDCSTESVTDTERAFVDALGVTYGGLAEGAGARVARTHDTDKGRVPGTDIRTTPTDATFVTGTAAHALDFDNSVPSIPAHVSCVVVPAICSIGSVADASRRDAIVAYLAVTKRSPHSASLRRWPRASGPTTGRTESRCMLASLRGVG